MKIVIYSWRWMGFGAIAFFPGSLFLYYGIVMTFFRARISRGIFLFKGSSVTRVLAATGREV